MPSTPKGTCSALWKKMRRPHNTPDHASESGLTTPAFTIGFTIKNRTGRPCRRERCAHATMGIDTIRAAIARYARYAKRKADPNRDFLRGLRPRRGALWRTTELQRRNAWPSSARPKSCACTASGKRRSPNSARRWKNGGFHLNRATASSRRENNIVPLRDEMPAEQHRNRAGGGPGYRAVPNGRRTIARFYYSINYRRS